MFLTLRRLSLVAVAALLIPYVANFADAGKTSNTKTVMSGEMFMFLLDAGMADQELDLLPDMGLTDSEIVKLYGLTTKDLSNVKGVSGLDLGSSRIKSFGESTGDGPKDF